jgi:hypothetical protein
MQSVSSSFLKHTDEGILDKVTSRGCGLNRPVGGLALASAHAADLVRAAASPIRPRRTCTDFRRMIRRHLHNTHVFSHLSLQEESVGCLRFEGWASEATNCLI